MVHFSEDIISLSSSIIEKASKLNYRITLAESCTGGLISSSITAVPGSSNVFTCGYVTYSNHSKNRILGVPMDAIEQFGAVSDVVASAMAEGALALSKADISLSVTGIAGPKGGTKDKPVGLVFLSIAKINTDALIKKYIFAGSRDEIRRSAISAGLSLLLNQLQ